MRETAMLASKSLGLFKEALKRMTRELVPNTWEAPVCCTAVTQPSLAESENSPGFQQRQRRRASAAHAGWESYVSPKDNRYKATQTSSCLEDGENQHLLQ